MKKIAFIIISLLLSVICCSAINEVEPNDYVTDSGVITLTSNETISGDVPIIDMDLWKIEAGTSGELTVNFNNCFCYVSLYSNSSEYTINSEEATVEFYIEFGGTVTVTLNSDYFYVIEVSSNLGFGERIPVSMPRSSNNSIYNILLSGSALPVELLSFQGYLNSKNQTDLIWQTASELNNHYFQVEHSTDARSFTPIGIVDGKGTTNESQNYHYRHLAPRFGQNYYRLKQVDFDGAFAYSDLVNVNYKIKGDLHPIVIYPNPVSEELSLTNISSGDLSLEVFNILGEFQFRAKLTEGQNKEFPTDHLMDGSYFIRIKTEHEYLKQKFIKISR